MPNVGFGELFMLFLVVLIVVGPKKLPEIARSLGRAYRTFTTEMHKAQETLRVAVDEAENPPTTTPGTGVIDVPDDHVAPPVSEPFQAASQHVAPATADEAAPAPAVVSDAVRRYEDT